MRMAVPTTPSWSWREPTRDEVTAFLTRQHDATWPYREIGATADNGRAPVGYNLDQNRVKLGSGAAAFEAACAALRAWRMFPTSWTRISPSDAPIRVGQT